MSWEINTKEELLKEVELYQKTADKTFLKSEEYYLEKSNLEKLWDWKVRKPITRRIDNEASEKWVNIEDDLKEKWVNEKLEYIAKGQEFKSNWADRQKRRTDSNDISQQTNKKDNNSTDLSR